VSLKFLHCADLHLDSPLQGLAFPPHAAERIRNATRRAFERVVAAAMDEHVDFVVIAGDIYDTGLQSYESALYFNRQMVRLSDQGIKTFLVYGNHDALSKLDKNTRLPASVKVFDHRKPESFVDDRELGVAIHGQSFGSSATVQDLAAKYPAAVPDLLNIGILHTSLSGIEGHAPYAPCSVESLVDKGYDYWALGHVHSHQVVHKHPHIVYPGNTQARQMREAGERYCEIVTSDGRALNVTPRAVAEIPWFDRTVDVAGASSRHEVVERLRPEMQAVVEAAGNRTAVVRLRLTGVTAAHGELTRDGERLGADARALADEVALDQLWLERLEVKTLPCLDLDRLARGQDPLGEVLRLVRDAASREDLAGVLDDLRKKLPAELESGIEGLSAASRGGVLPEVEARLAARLAEEGGPED
jgi:DNA repair exonuclease SbcCD nuclease subunit